MRKGNWPGDWKAVCDVCGFWFHSSDLQKRWDNLMVCHKDYETKHPQLYIKVLPETIAPPWVRTDPADTFVAVCTLLTNQGVADAGTADCAQADRNNNLPYQSI